MLEVKGMQTSITLGRANPFFLVFFVCSFFFLINSVFPQQGPMCCITVLTSHRLDLEALRKNRTELYFDCCECPLCFLNLCSLILG